jgi:hypothetical protein
MKSKKAMELSINFIVMLIIAMALFSFGIWFAYKFFGGAEQMRTDLDSQTQTQIENLLMSGNDRVVIPYNSKTLDKSNSAIFGVGILNVVGDQETFRIEIIDEKNYIGCGYLEIIPSIPISITLVNNQNIVKSFGIQVKKIPQNKPCIFDLVIKVFDNENNLYGGPQKIYIKYPEATETCSFSNNPACNG